MIGPRWVLLSLVLGCTRARQPTAVADSTATPLEQSLARPVPNRVQGRFSFTVEAEASGFAASTGGVVILDRPGRGHLAILGPLGGPLATLQTDGTGAAVAIARDRRHYVAADADRVLREATHGLVGLDELLGLFVGDVPVEGLKLRSQQPRAAGPYEVVFDGPEGTALALGLDPILATPVSLVGSDAAGGVLLDLRYEPFAPMIAGGPLVPTDFALALPTLGVHLDVRMKSWTVPEPMPDVFGLEVPEGFTSSPLEDTVRTWAQLLIPTQLVPMPAGRMDTSEEGG